MERALKTPQRPTQGRSVAITRSVRAGRAIALMVLTAVAAAGCELPTSGDAGTVEAAYYSWIEARRTHDTATLWESLEPTAQAEFTAWFQAEQKAQSTIKTQYPTVHMKAALESLKLGERAALKSAQQLFLHVVRSAPGEELGTMAKLGARVRGVEIEGENATVTTWGGDSWVFANADGTWKATLSAAEMERLRNARQRAEANLATAELNVERLSGAK